MIELIIYTIYQLVQLIQPILVPLCFLLAWVFIITLVWSVYSALKDTTERAQKMHQIPCTNCQFFTNDYRLKCTVQPRVANTEQAIDCSDYCPR